jgi:AmmeMemoRadiSam system protein B
MSKIIKIVFVVIIIVSAIIVAGFFLTKNQNEFLDISGVVVPHHDLMAQKRADFFKDLAKSIREPSTIILVSPNHFNVGIGDIQTTNQTWSLSSGKIYPDNDVISFLQKDTVANIEPTSFVKEHGIYNILSDIYNNFPNTKLVPIILREGVSFKKINKLEQAFLQSCKNCLVVASVDFSHYQTHAISELNDKNTINWLSSVDYKNLIEKAQVDSPAALAMLALWAKDHNTLYFELKDYIGSTNIYKDSDIDPTTHVFGWYVVKLYK